MLQGAKIHFPPSVYCCVPQGNRLQQTASPLSSEETRSVNPLVRTQVDQS